jgi:hypothetical protein
MGTEPSQEPKLVRALERGRISFVVRPRVEGAPGVQRFAFVLSPAGAERHRRVMVGKKRMPAPGANEREWAYVDRLAASRSEALADLGPTTYNTKTRGLRHQPGARVIARGNYGIVEHGEHAHLTYALDPETERDGLLDAMNVKQEGSLIAAVFNPLGKWSPPSAQETLPYVENQDDFEGVSPFSEPSIYPDELQARFGDRRFAPLDPAFLDYEGAELVLIGAEDELRAELAIAV